MRLRPDLIELNYEVADPVGVLAIPRGTGMRRDGLWKASCFELFVGKPDSASYREFNFSPGGDWAAYGFSGYRTGQHDLLMHSEPLIESKVTPVGLSVRVRVSLDDLESGDPIGICAVIEEREFGLSYWSLRHAGPSPDFHHPTCFAATLPAPSDP
ncbi:MAG: DOMON-like domain-containing protein [Novosphingobium sp.]|uniref:DOMON-like domain-containing protein n=1 Tax=Novosphingobium sp. TaxID=1874826 RepID=UPI0032B8F49C